MNMEAIKAAWQCIVQHYPDMAAAILQIVGAASVLYKFLSSKMIASGGGSVVSGAKKVLKSVALNHTETP